jgi:hypothetical protein
MTVFSAATAGSDYTATSGHIDWADGEIGVKYIPVTLLADQQTESIERFAVNITGITGGAPLVGIGSSGGGGGALDLWCLLLAAAAAARTAVRGMARN